jgi:hypothetical protein
MARRLKNLRKTSFPRQRNQFLALLSVEVLGNSKKEEKKLRFGM